MTPPPQAIFLPALLLFFAPLTIALTNATKLPFYAPTDTTKFLGNDGFWSTVTLRVGTPPQPIFVHPFLSTSLILVPNSVWCSNLTYSGYSCDSRGRGFSTSLSSTWRPIGQYDLDIRPELEDDRVIYGVTDLGYGEFGEDVVMMKEGDDAGREVSVQEIAVGAVNDSTVLLGELGLGVDVRSFDAQTTSEGMLGKLWKTGQIPGRSFGYTAGNYYRPKKVPVDLVLGGYNTAQFIPNEVSFPLSKSNLPIATLRNLRVSATGTPPWGPGSQDLLLTPVPVQIDSSTPFIWLPPEVCRRFEQNLNITWNETSNLYILPDSVYADLNALNLSFNFTLTAASSSSSSPSVEISVPYASLSLRLKWPFTNITTDPLGLRYFPLKRASSEDQYTLGRSFLQDAYIILDYDRGNFSVHSTVPSPGDPTIVPILYPTDSPPPSPKKPGLSTGAIVGIVVGAIAGLLIAAGAAWWFCVFLPRRERQRRSEAEKEEARKQNVEFFQPPPPGVAEAFGNEVQAPWMGKPPQTASEIGGSTMLGSDETGDRREVSELPENSRAELTAVGMDPAELPGAEVGGVGGSHHGWEGSEMGYDEVPTSRNATMNTEVREYLAHGPQAGEGTYQTQSTEAELGTESTSAYSQSQAGGRYSHVVTPTSEGRGSVTRWSPMSPMTPPANYNLGEEYSGERRV